MVTDLAEVAEWLDGSPYSLPDDQSERKVLEDMLPRALALEGRCDAVRQRLQAELTNRLSRATRTSEIYESNAIEGKTATLAETFEILSARRMWSAEQAVAAYSLQEVLRQEPKVQDVVGLAAARLLVDEYISSGQRTLAEADLREMHSMILRGHRTAGRYKLYLNEISGSSHTPTAPSDVPAAMGSLVRWARDSPAPLLWKAAATHAWLTHIHPFEDGNGRIARLLANYVLGAGCYPPLIVKSSSDRPRYIAALSHSDSAGDIVPLVRLFVRVLNRGIEFMERPEFAWTLFQKDLQAREQSVHLRWQSTLERFLEEVSARLALAGVSLDVVAVLAASDFELLQQRNRLGNAWLAKAVSRGARRDLLVWVGHVSGSLYQRLERDQVFPSLFLSERDPNPRAAKPYLPSVRGLPAHHDELCLLPDEGRAVLRRGGAIRTLGLPQAAELWATLLTEYLGQMAEEEARSD